MNKRETRRINPIAKFVAALAGLVFIVEALVIGGVLELKASTVEKYAPWAHEPFLKLVGEHPDSPNYFLVAEESNTSTNSVALPADESVSELPDVVSESVPSVVPSTGVDEPVPMG